MSEEYKPESYFHVLFTLLYGLLPKTFLRSDAVVLCVVLVCFMFIYFAATARMQTVHTDKISLLVERKTN